MLWFLPDKNTNGENYYIVRKNKRKYGAKFAAIRVGISRFIYKSLNFG